MFDVCIVGAGGIVGCAIARELALHGFTLAGIEKHSAVCQETSGSNSRVIHSGFHEAAGTVKATLAREGSGLITSYAEEHGIDVLRSGMLIAIPHGGIRGGLWREADALWNLWRQGRRQNIQFHFVIGNGGIRRIAPIRALGGIYIPSVCVINVEAVAESLTQDAKAAGAQILYESEVIGIDVRGSHHVIHTTRGDVQAHALINSAGLHAHAISQMAGGPEYEVEFIRGDYYELKGGIERWGIRTLLYPAMPPGSRSKGIHFSPRTNGRLYIGPSATPTSQPAHKSVFLEAARKFLPDIRDDDLEWAYFGVRPKRPAHDDKPDFTIRIDRRNPPLVNLIGIDSPGLSASMGIARYVKKLLIQV